LKSFVSVISGLIMTQLRKHSVDIRIFEIIGYLSDMFSKSQQQIFANLPKHTFRIKAKFPSPFAN